MGTTPLQSLPYPDLDAAANVPADMQTALVAVEKKLIMAFASTAARDAAITSPVEGMLAAITGDNVVTIYTGSAWEILGSYGAETSYTPSWTGITTGNGTSTGGYARMPGRGVRFWAKFVLGTTSAITGAVTVSLPVTASPGLLRGQLGIVLLDTGVAQYVGTSEAGTTTITINALNSGASYAGATPLSSTVPHTWGNTDEIQVSGVYTAAS